MKLSTARKLDAVLNYGIGAACGVIFALICLALSQLARITLQILTDLF